MLGPIPQGIRSAGRSLHLPQNTNQAPEQDVAGYSCSMVYDHSDGTRRLWNFSPDPVGISWGLNATINLMPTRGGQVAYSTARIIGPLTIVGYLRSSWDMLSLAKFTGEHMKEFQINGKTLRFVYPERDLDFSMGIQSFNDISFNGEQGEIKAYTLICVITQDHTALNQAEPSKLLPGLPENIEWISVENSAKIAEERFGLTFGSGGGTPSPEGEETTPEETTPEGAPKEEPPKKPQTFGKEPNLINDWLEGRTGRTKPEDRVPVPDIQGP